MNSINHKILKDAITVTLLSLVGQVLGFVATMLVAKNFGANWITDSYYLAFVIPGTFVTVIGGVVKIVFIPVFVEERLKNPENVSGIIGSTISAMLIASGIGVIAIIIIAYSNIISLGLNPEAKALTKLLLFELLPLVPLTVISGVLNATYNSYQRFGLAEVAIALRFLVVIAAIIFLSKQFGIHSLAFGNVAGQLLTLMVTAWIIRKKLGLDIIPRFSFSPAFRRMFRMALLPFLSYVLVQFNPLTSRFIASFLPTGSVSVINYAEKLVLIPSLFISTGFYGVILSYWSRYTVEGNEQEMQHSLNRCVSMLITILMPMVAGLYILSEPITRLLFERGAFGNEAVLITAHVFSILIVAVIPTYLHMLIVRVLTANQDFLALFWLSSMNMVLHPIFSFLLAIILDQGPAGIALSNLWTFSVMAFTTAYIVHKRYMRFSMDILGKNILRAIMGCLLMFIAIHSMSDLLHTLVVKHGLFLEILAVTLTGSLIYIGFLSLMRHPDICVFWGMISGAFNKK